MPLLSELEFGSYLTYCPRGESVVNKQSRDVRNALKFDQKRGNPPIHFTQHIVNEIVSNLDSLPFQNYFGENVLLVPVPNSGLMKEDTLWIPHRLVKEMASKGLGIESTCLKRIKAIPKSATSNSENRPGLTDHYDSLKCEPSLYNPEKIVLVDDFVTRGATLLGCASKLRDSFPKAEIFAFTIIRTISEPEQFESIRMPCTGTIIRHQNSALRRP